MRTSKQNERNKRQRSEHNSKSSLIKRKYLQVHKRMENRKKKDSPHLHYREQLMRLKGSARSNTKGKGLKWLSQSSPQTEL